MNTFCPECGPNVVIDEDGCCAYCGATATGGAVDCIKAFLKAEENVPEKQKINKGF